MLAKEIPLLDEMEVYEVRGVDVHICLPRPHEDSGEIVVPVWFRANNALYTFLEGCEVGYTDTVREVILERATQIFNV